MGSPTLALGLATHALSLCAGLGWAGLALPYRTCAVAEDITLGGLLSSLDSLRVFLNRHGE